MLFPVAWIPRAVTWRHIMDRREFLKAGALAAAVAAVASKLPAQALAAPEEAPKDTPEKIAAPDVVVVRNGEPVAMFRKGIEALGGMTAFVKPGQSVCVKPNIGWDRRPELAACTNPELVGEIVRQCVAAGASKVDVFDNTCHNWVDCYKTSGIKDAVEKAGGTMLPANDDFWYVDREAPGAVQMKSARVHKTLLAADVVINVPICKVHGGAMTACMKNWMGVVQNRRYMHLNNLQQCIADSILYRKPDLNVLDAYRVMVSNGPQGRSLDDVETPRYLLISKDPVVLDAMGVRLLRRTPEQVPHIAMAEKLGLGVADPEKHNVLRLEI